MTGMNVRILEALLSLMLVAGGTRAASADGYPTQALGVQPEKAYQLGDVDHINLFNGNLVLSIPIGQRYPVGANFSYGLNLVYNSNTWDFLQIDNAVAALPKRNSNAGMGWLLTLGQIQEPTDPANQTGAWLYTGPDGAERQMYLSLHSDDQATGGRQYTRDGTYVRLRGLYANGTIVYLDFPDGTIYTFSKFGTYDWRITGINDPFGNSISVSYPTYPGPHWVVTDNWGRTTTVWLQPTTTCPASSGCYPYRVQTVVVPTFNGGYATYGFNYTDLSVPRPCPSNDPAYPSPITESFLTSVTLPDGSSWTMPASSYITSTTDCKTYGELTSLVVPTRGQLQWSYGRYSFPTDETGAKHIWRTNSPGVVSRSEASAPGAVLGTWTYTPSLTSNPAAPQYPVEAVRLAQTPLGHTTVNYFSVAVPSGSPPAPWTPVEYGLPLTHNQSDPYTAYPLSTQVYPCVVTNPASPPCAASRTTYQVYAADTVGSAATVMDLTHLNQRVSATRIIYNDDSLMSSGFVYSNFDGLGHFRQIDQSGNLSSLWNVLTSVTDYNPRSGTYPGPSFVLPDINGPWVLGTYDYQTRQHFSLVSKTESCFDPATGFLLRKRVLQYGTSEGPNDLLTVYTQGTGGNVSAEDSFGGDTQNLSTLCASTCSCALGTGPYHVDNTYSAGTLATSRYLGAAFYSTYRTIDTSTGLVSASQDASGLTTTYSYDSMGRIQSMSPPGQLTTFYTYTPASPSAPAKVDVATTSDTTHSSLLFDDLGRVTQESRLDPTGYNYRQTLYDGAGNKASVSAWGSFGNKTQYRFYDPFGRPQQILAPDGHQTQLTYYGVREVDRTVSIALAGGEQGETTREIYDAQGQLQQVQEAAGGTVTTYDHDIGNRPLSVSSTAGGTTQTRAFTYDNRGFLLSEQQPEKGPNGNGAVTYGGYDALGHPGNMVDGPNSLNYGYDAAGRLTLVTDGNHANRTLKSFSYSSGNGSGGSGFSLGKILQSSRFNYITASGNPYTVEIRHGYTYGDGSVSQNVGRVTNRTTQFFVNGGGTAAETYSQTFSYDSLGNVQTLGYPQCTAGACTVANSVSFNYTRNLLTSVPGYADSIAYSPSRQVRQVQHHNGLTDTIVPDASFMPRPGAFSTALTSNPNALYWSTGTYAYDGTGNVKSIGPSSFAYDPVGRLTASTLYTDAVTPIHAVTHSSSFDGFGNTLSITTNGTTVNTPTSSTTNRLSAPTTYDAAGNVTSWNGQTYVFDAFDQVIRFCASTCGSGEDWTYMYDADDERTWLFKNYQNTYRRTLRDLSGNLLRDYFNNATTSTVEDYIHRGGQLLAAQVTQNGVAQPTRHFSLDHLGTVRLITDANGAQLTYHAYYPTGREATYVDQDSERRKFTGHERDLGDPTSDADDLDYMHARHYSLLTGRFLSVEEEDAEPGRPQSWNRYSYAFNSPQHFVDPNGRSAAAFELVYSAGGTGLEVGEVLTAAAPGAVAVVGFGAGYWIGSKIGDTSVGGATINSQISEGMADLMLIFSKQTGRQIPSDLEGKQVHELLEALKTATGKARADILKALKALGARNKQKARGGKREPKTPPQADEADDTFDFLLEEAIANDPSAIFDLSMPELTVPLTSTLTEERLTICGVGIVSCPF